MAGVSAKTLIKKMTTPAMNALSRGRADMRSSLLRCESALIVNRERHIVKNGQTAAQTRSSLDTQDICARRQILERDFRSVRIRFAGCRRCLDRPLGMRRKNITAIRRANRGRDVERM